MTLIIKILTVALSTICALQGAIEFSFDFPLRNYAFYIPHGKLFVAAATQGTAKEKAIMSSTRYDAGFVALAPEKIIIDGKADQANPLFDSAIDHMQMIGHRLLITKKDEPVLFALDDKLRQSAPELYVASDIADANGIKSPKILAITSTLSNIIQDPENLTDETGAFVAVSNQDGKFTGSGSGISVLTLTPNSENENSPIRFAWQYYNSQTGVAKENKAVPVGIDMSELKIGSNLANISNAIDMYYDNDLKCLYCALDVTASGDEDSGARGLLVGIVKEGKLIFSPIAPETAFDSGDSCVGAKGPNVHIQVSKVTTMFTRTHLKYLIVLAGSSISGTTDSNSQVYALPLVNNFNSGLHGTLANVNANPFDIFSSGPAYRFQGRAFLHAAERPEDLYRNGSGAALVGGGAPLPGAINSLVTVNDAVFVSVLEDGNNLKSGIFHSQAIFDNSGKIVLWTRWQRAGGAAMNPAGFVTDPYNGAFWTLKSSGLDLFSTVSRTNWAADKGSLEQLVKSEFADASGVQGMFDFNYMTSSFSDEVTHRLSLLAFTGYNKVLLVQSGHDLDGNFGPETRDIISRKYSSNNGTLANLNSDVSVISISGGQLSKIGAITSVAFVADQTNGWLVVAGVGGLAILANSDGSGYNSLQGLGRDFSGLTGSMEFKTLGSFKNVRKLISVANELFVLTDKNLIKLTISRQSILENNVSSTIIAQVGLKSLNEVNAFSDMIIMPPLAVLATSNGLFILSKNDNILTDDYNNLRWNLFHLPESAGSIAAGGPVTRLHAITYSGLETDNSLGANIYVLNGAVSTSQAHIYRLYIPGSNNQVSLLPDLFVKDKPTFFASIGDYRNFVTTDGGFLATTRSAYGNKSAFLEFFPPYVKSGQRFASRNSMPLFMDKARSIGLLLRNSATGNFSIAGDFGIRINS